MEGMLTSGVKLGSVHPLVRALFSEVESFTFLSERDRLGVEGFFEHLQWINFSQLPSEDFSSSWVQMPDRALNKDQLINKKNLSL